MISKAEAMRKKKTLANVEANAKKYYQEAKSRLPVPGFRTSVNGG
jgi:phage gp46-like protein